MISALKLFCDVCFYLAFLTLTPFFSSAHALNAVIVISTLIAGFLADRERRMPIRILLLCGRMIRLSLPQIWTSMPLSKRDIRRRKLKRN